MLSLGILIFAFVLLVGGKAILLGGKILKGGKVRLAGAFIILLLVGSQFLSPRQGFLIHIVISS